MGEYVRACGVVVMYRMMCSDAMGGVGISIYGLQNVYIGKSMICEKRIPIVRPAISGLSEDINFLALLYVQYSSSFPYSNSAVMFPKTIGYVRTSDDSQVDLPCPRSTCRSSLLKLMKSRESSIEDTLDIVK